MKDAACDQCSVREDHEELGIDLVAEEGFRADMQSCRGGKCSTWSPSEPKWYPAWFLASEGHCGAGIQGISPRLCSLITPV